MYVWVLFFHSLVRWLALILLVGAALWSLAAWVGGRPWTRSDRRLVAAATGAIDTQLLLGMVLYVALSPITRAAFGDMGQAMKDPVARFWAVEHAALMLGAWGLAHVGSVMAKRAKEADRHRWVAILFGLALLLVLAGIPWPFREAVARPWLTLPL